MKYVPSLPPVSGLAERDEVLALSRTRRVNPVQSRTMPPLVIQPQKQVAAEPLHEVEKRETLQESRRKYCRRVSHQTMLEELRSGIERRRNRQRGDDDAEHIDEQV